MEMKFVLRLAGAAGVLATLVLSGCAVLNRDPGDPRPPRLFSEDYYDYHANLPVGSRQVCRYGKLWPPFPRPTDPRQPCMQRYHAANYWPYPYMCQDRESVNSYIQTHVDNGWILQTTLYEYHFNEETCELNQAGLTHLQWILQNAPNNTACVGSKPGPPRPSAILRLSAVQVAAAEMVGPENVPQVMLRADSPNGLPAQHIDTQYRSFLSTMPEPRISMNPRRASASELSRWCPSA